MAADNIMANDQVDQKEDYLRFPSKSSLLSERLKIKHSLSHFGTPDQSTDRKVKQLKRELEGWREVILPLNSVLLWEKNWYPGMLIGVSTTLFLMFWYLDPSILTTVSVIGLIATLVDYLVPTLTASICHPESWTGTKERKLEEICRGLANTQSQAAQKWVAFYDMRHSRPKMYYAVVVSSLLFFAWLGNMVNNLLLTYLAVTTTILLPGMKHHGLLQKYFAQIMIMVSESIKGIKQKKN